MLVPQRLQLADVARQLLRFWELGLKGSKFGLLLRKVLELLFEHRLLGLERTVLIELTLCLCVKRSDLCPLWGDEQEPPSYEDQDAHQRSADGPLSGRRHLTHLSQSSCSGWTLPPA